MHKAETDFYLISLLFPQPISLSLITAQRLAVNIEKLCDSVTISPSPSPSFPPLLLPSCWVCCTHSRAREICRHLRISLRYLREATDLGYWLLLSSENRAWLPHVAALHSLIHSSLRRLSGDINVGIPNEKLWEFHFSRKQRGKRPLSDLKSGHTVGEFCILHVFSLARAHVWWSFIHESPHCNDSVHSRFNSCFLLRFLRFEVQKK